MPLVVPAWIFWSCQRTGINNVTPGLCILLFSPHLPSKGTAAAYCRPSGILLGKRVCKPVYHHPISQSRKHRPIRSSWVPEQYLREECSTAPQPPKQWWKHWPQSNSRELFPIPAQRSGCLHQIFINKGLQRGGTSCEKQSGDVVWRLKYVTFWDISIVYRASGTTHMKSKLSQKIQDKW